MKIEDILNNIDNASLTLPVFQRGYVWKRPQVRSLMESLYKGHPVGSLLIWTTQAELVDVKTPSNDAKTSGPINLLLDGQQRVTSLYGTIRGTSPGFFEGDAKAFLNLYFNLDTEEFEFFSQAKMGNDPLWVGVTNLFSSDNKWITQLTQDPELAPQIGQYIQRGTKLTNITQTDLPNQFLTGDDKTTDIVVEIFNRVNSGGTKLSKADLALARICADWPEARTEMQRRLDKWKQADFDAKLDWLLRCIAALKTGFSEYERLGNLSAADVQSALLQTESAVDRLLEAMRSHLCMDNDKVFNNKQAFPIIVRYLVDRGGKFADERDLAQILQWYLGTTIWGRFSGPTETVINQDLAAVQEGTPIDALLRNLQRSIGERREVTEADFNMDYNKSRFYTLLYIMSRVLDARDWGTGNQLRQHSLGDHTNLEMHHIFPRKVLQGRTGRVNNLGNIAFQTRETNRAIGARYPAEYMPEIVNNWPGKLESQWVPDDPTLWTVDRYEEFLGERRRLLANGANELLKTLREGSLPGTSIPATTLGDGEVSAATDLIETGDFQDEWEILEELNEFVTEQGLASGETNYELFDPDKSELLAVLDLAWPDGLQTGYTRPVAVLIDEMTDVRLAATNAGFRVFTSPDMFKRYVERDLLLGSV